MKNLIKRCAFIVVALLISTVMLADNGKTCSVEKNGETIGYVTAYINSEGHLLVSNDTNNRVTVKVELNTGGDKYVSVEPRSTTDAGDVGTGNLVKSVSNPVCN